MRILDLYRGAIKKDRKCDGGDKWIWRWAPCKARHFSRLVVSKWNVLFGCNLVKMMVPHDCHALLEKKTIVTKATPLVITVHPCCNAR